MNRRELREHIFKMLFRADFYEGEEQEAQLELYLQGEEEESEQEIKESDKEYMLEKTKAIIAALKPIDEVINQASENWKTARMGKVDLTILRLAVYEIHYDKDIPEKVAINEAVELSKKYGMEDTFAFVNGVLAKVCKQNK